MRKLILIILDGCGFNSAIENCGFLEHMAECGKAAKYKVNSELPSMSRPIYATLMTGLPVSEHGIYNNLMNNHIDKQSIFSLCRKAGFKTAAAAYHWFAELFVRSPFCFEKDRYIFDESALIQNGIYYFEDNYPDSHLFCDAVFLAEAYSPDFLLAHSMNIDNDGHKFGFDSKEYSMSIMKADIILSSLIPYFSAKGYDVVVTADHGMSEKGLHGGNTPIQREVPLYIFSPLVKKQIQDKKAINQLLVAPLLCKLMEIEPSDEMLSLDNSEVCFFE